MNKLGAVSLLGCGLIVALSWHIVPHNDESQRGAAAVAESEKGATSRTKEKIELIAETGKEVAVEAEQETAMKFDMKVVIREAEKSMRLGENYSFVPEGAVDFNASTDSEIAQQALLMASAATMTDGVAVDLEIMPLLTRENSDVSRVMKVVDTYYKQGDVSLSAVDDEGWYALPGDYYLVETQDKNGKYNGVISVQKIGKNGETNAFIGRVISPFDVTENISRELVTDQDAQELLAAANTDLQDIKHDGLVNLYAGHHRLNQADTAYHQMNAYNPAMGTYETFWLDARNTNVIHTENSVKNVRYLAAAMKQNPGYITKEDCDILNLPHVEIESCLEVARTIEN